MEKSDEKLKSEVQGYWNSNPMNYYITDGYGTEHYFNELDRKNIKWGTPLEGSTHPEAQGLIDYEKDIAGKQILEVGIGLGSLFGSMAKRARMAAGVDLTPFAARTSKKRLELFNIQHAYPINSDAENLPFASGSFDTVVSWGVIHHTPNTPRAAQEIHRVLKPGGTALVMIYHRNSLFYWYKMMVGWGIGRGELLRYTPQEIINRHLDPNSPLNKVYSVREGREMFGMFQDVRTSITGGSGFGGVPTSRFPFISKTILRGKVKEALVKKYGYFLWIRARK
jgi:SAM-dependent methyltransferase